MIAAKRYIWFAMFIAFLTLYLPAAAQEAQERRILARNWTCDASIFLIGTNQSYTPPTWKMKTGDPDAVQGDRHTSCKRYIQNKILVGSIWSRLNLTPADKDSICKKGRGEFRVGYGFDKRGKQWDFTSTLSAPPCDCELTCKPGYDLGTTGTPRCVRLLCEGAAAGIPDERFGPHEKGVGIWSGNVYHHQPVQKGQCTFKGSQGTWTRWLNRDLPSGTGDFETLQGFLQGGRVPQSCSTPKKIECRRTGTTQLVETGIVNGQRYTCEPTVGGVCDNRQQNPGVRCSDYEVRFLCP